MSDGNSNGSMKGESSWSEDVELMERLRGIVEGEIAIAEAGSYAAQSDGADELESASDGELYRMESALRRSIAKCSNDRERRPLEFDLCYVQREIDIRQRRTEVAKALREAEESEEGGYGDE